MAYAGRVTTPEAEQSQSEPIDEGAREQSGALESAADGSAVAGSYEAQPGDGSSSQAEPGGEPSQQVGAEGEASSQAEPDGETLQQAGTDGGTSEQGTSEQTGTESVARPEERLERAVRAAEQALIEFEIAVETFRVEVDNFSRLHHQKLGPMYSRLDELEALIAEARAARTGDPEDLRKADEARARVMPMPGVEELFHGWMDSEGLFPEAVAMLTDQPVRPPQRVRPSDEARKLFRELVRKAHPDLAQDEDERKRRDEFITRVNAAYARGDEALLRGSPRSGPRVPCPRSGSRAAARSSTPGSSGSPSARRCSRSSPASWRRAPSARCSRWLRRIPTGSWRRSPNSC